MARVSVLERPMHTTASCVHGRRGAGRTRRNYFLKYPSRLKRRCDLDPDLVPAMQGLANWLTYRFGGFPESLDWGNTEPH